MRGDDAAQPLQTTFVEDVEAIAAQKREIAPAGQLVPEPLELDGGFAFATLPEDVHHLAEGAGVSVRPPVFSLVEQRAHDRLESSSDGPAGLHEAGKCLFGVRRQKRIGGVAETGDDRGDVFRSRNHDSGVAALEAGGEVGGDGVGELTEVRVQLHSMVRAIRSPQEIGPGHVARLSAVSGE